MSIADKLIMISENEQKVFEAGEKRGYDSLYDIMWDTIQDKGARTSYSAAFSNSSWNDHTFRPKYDIKPSKSAGDMCRYSSFSDLQSCLDYNGVKFDFSECTSVYQLFRDNKVLSTVAALDVSLVKGNCGGMFQSCSALSEIGLMTVSENNTGYNGTFQQATGLVTVRFAGVIANSMSFQWSPLLSADSVVSIISCLKQNTTGCTITLHSNSWNALVEKYPTPSDAGFEFTHNTYDPVESPLAPARIFVVYRLGLLRRNYYVFDYNRKRYC